MSSPSSEENLEEFKDLNEEAVQGLEAGDKKCLDMQNAAFISHYERETGKKTIKTRDIEITSLASEIGEFKGAMKDVTKVNTNYGSRALKAYTYPGLEENDIIKDLQVQRISYFVSHDFNKELREVGVDPIDVRWPAYTKRQRKMGDIDTYFDGKYYHYGVEQWINGTWKKYNLNTGEIFPDNPPEVDDIVQSFTHYSLLYSAGSFMICDIQGCGTTLCDCQIISLEGNKTAFDLGEDAMMVFISQHTCGETCRKLNLPNFKQTGSLRSCLDLSNFRINRGIDLNEKASVLASNHLSNDDQSRRFMSTVLRAKVSSRVEDSLMTNQQRREEMLRKKINARREIDGMGPISRDKIIRKHQHLMPPPPPPQHHHPRRHPSSHSSSSSYSSIPDSLMSMRSIQKVLSPIQESRKSPPLPPPPPSFHSSSSRSSRSFSSPPREDGGEEERKMNS